MAAARLKIGDLHKVRNELWDARTKWKDFGLAMGMDVNTLDNIDLIQRGDSGNCLRDMLSEWLKGANDPPRTWSTIAAALKEVKSLEAIAEEIESKYGLVGNPAPVTTKPPNTKPDKVIVPPSTAAPTMKLLTKWKVLSLVAAKWRGLADLLDFDPSVTSAIGEKHNRDPELSCREIFSRWLTGETGSAPSWGDLLEALDDLNYKVLADDLRSKLGA